MPSVYRILKSTLDDIADAIRAKTGNSASMTPAQMVTEIESITTGVTNFVTGTLTPSANTSSLDIVCDFEPDYIIIQGDLTGDVALWGVKMLWIVRDDEALMLCDTSQTGLNMSYYGSNQITDLNETCTTVNVPCANYQNGSLTVTTHGNRSYTNFSADIEYRYFLYKNNEEG